VYVADESYNLIRKITPAGDVSTFAGSGVAGSTNGTGTAASFYYPRGVATDASGNVFVSEDGELIRKITPAGVVTTLAGSGAVGSANGTGMAASFNHPWGVATDASGNVYVADTYNNLIRKITSGGVVTTFAGSGVGGSADGNGVAASFSAPAALIADALGNIYVADLSNNLIRKITPAGVVSTIAGSGASGSTNGVGNLASFSGLYSITIDASGNIYAGDAVHNLIRKIKATGYSIAPALPPGLSFGATTGTISGTPTAASPATTYTVTAYNLGGSGSATVSIKVNASSNASLSGLKVSSGTLNPVFASGTTGYTATVSNTITSITVKPTTSDATATIKLNGATVASGASSQTIPLSIGPNIITTIVTAQDGVTTKTYELTVTRAGSANANLSALHLNNGTLTPSFLQGTINYTANVANNVSSITITPATADINATMTVNGTPVTSGAVSQSLPLNAGPNTITTMVTAQNGTTTKAYTVTVTRAVSANANLASLVLSNCTLTPVFASGTINYKASVANNIASITVTPATADAGATVTVNGTTVASGSVSAGLPLAVGPNIITTVVTAQSGTPTKTYTVTVTRAPSANANLVSMHPSNGSLSPSFLQGTTGYTANVANSVLSMTIIPTSADAGATVTVNNVAVASGSASQSLPLAVGPNTITTVVTAQNGTTTKTYTLTVTRATGPLGAANPQDYTAMPADNGTSDGVIVHQGVSANGDGMNDALTIEGITKYPDNKLSIMSRSGILIYEAKGYDNASKRFDGHSNKTGKLQQAGTYFYSLEYKAEGITKIKTGFIVLKY
jgi:gliding motility-associated-like protein